MDRFHELLRMRYFDQGRFFRVVPGFIAQFGVHRDFKVHDRWREFFIVDDPPTNQKNVRGTLSFAKSGPNTRATEMFINLVDNPALDEDYFVPFAKVVSGMDVVDRFYSGYGRCGRQGRISIPQKWRVKPTNTWCKGSRGWTTSRRLRLWIEPRSRDSATALADAAHSLLRLGLVCVAIDFGALEPGLQLRAIQLQSV